MRGGEAAGAAAPVSCQGPPAAPGRAALAAEVAAVLAATVVLVWTLRRALLPPVTRTFGHDLIFWYPIWQYFAEGLSLGQVRYWNPLSYAGVPLYPALLQLRAFDPISFITMLGGGLVSSDLLGRYNWDLFLRAWIPAVASHVFLRRFADHGLTRVLLAPVIFWSSFLLVMLRVHGAGQGFLCAPVLAILLHRLLWLGDMRWRIWAGLGVFLGLNWQSYFFAPHATFAALLAVAMALWQWPRVRRVLAAPRVVWKGALAVLVLAVMLVPLLIVVGESGEVVYLPRVLDTSRPSGKVGAIQYEPLPSSSVHEVGLLMPHHFFVGSGTPSTIWNFLQLLTPTGNWHREGGHGWGNPSEAFMYLGLLVHAAALLGLVAGRHPLRPVWALLLLVYGLLLLGPLGGAQSFLAWVFPLVRLTRHTHTYTPYFQLAVLFFFVVGLNRLTPFLTGLRAQALPLDGPSLARPPVWLPRAGLTLGAVFLVYLLAFELPTALRVFPPGKALTPALVAAGLVALWWLARHLAPMRMFWLALLGHLAAVPVLLTAPVLWGLHTPPAGGLALTLGRLGGHWAVFLLVPLGLLALARGGRLPRRVACVVLVALCAGDLLAYLTYTDYLWNWPRPDRILGVSARPTPPAFHPARGLYPEETERTRVFGQAIRYPELLLRRPYLFTAPRYPQAAARDPAPPMPARFEAARLAERWNSFYVPRRYLSLVHGGAPAEALVTALAVGERIVRFVPSYAVVADADLGSTLGRLGAEGARCLVGTAVLLPSRPPGLERLEREPGVPEGEGGRCAGTGPDAAGVTVRRYDGDSLVLDVTAARDGFLVFSDGYHPRWIAELDGEPVPVLRAYQALKAVALPSGRHRVTFGFAPGLLGPALAVFSTLGLLGAGAMAAACATALVGHWRGGPAEANALEMG